MGSAAPAEDAPPSPSLAGNDGVNELETSEAGLKQREGPGEEEVQVGTPAASVVMPVEMSGDRVDLYQEVVLPPISSPGQKRKRNKKERGSKKRRSVKEGGAEEEKTEDETIGNAESMSMVTEEVDPCNDNMILKKLLRWPRYFDPESHHSETCYNCGEPGHLAKDCNVEKRKKPCFICGLFGHAAKTCTLGTNCYICNKGGHIAEDCPDKHQKITECSNICLRCGNFGHNMFSCTNEYSPKDLEEIQCYICNKFGHLCCYEVSYINTGQVSCYNCGQPGHSGVGCAKTWKDKSGTDSPSICYVCGEEGHFARGCTKNAKRLGRQKHESANQTSKRKKKKRMVEPHSAPPEFHHPQKKKHKSPEFDGWKFTSRKSRIKGGWIVDDPGDYAPYDKFRGNTWASPLTPYKKGKSHNFSIEDRYSKSWLAYKKPRGYARTTGYSKDYCPRTPRSYDGFTYHQHGSGSGFCKSRRKYWRY